MSERVERPVLSVDETAEMLGISRNGCYEAIKRGELPVIRIGRRILVSRAALQELLATGRTLAADGRHDRREGFDDKQGAGDRSDTGNSRSSSSRSSGSASNKSSSYSSGVQRYRAPAQEQAPDLRDDGVSDLWNPRQKKGAPG